MTTRTKGARLTSTGYADILSAIIKNGGSATSAQIAVKVDAFHRTIQGIMWRMVDLQVLYVSAWRPNSSGHGPYVPCYSLAYPGKESVSYPEGLIQRQRTLTKWKVKPELVGFCGAFKTLLESGATTSQMVKAGGGCGCTVRKLVRHCKKAGLIYICRWEKQQYGPFMPVYAVGSGKDAPKPEPLGPRASWRAYYARKRAARNADPFAMPEDFEAPVKRVTVRASDRAVPPTKAVASVFALGVVSA